ncbi:MULTISPECIES: amidohydrolase [Leucobacter]|uniref:amidohydrolase n=1 Tax=Leucobacter TaxID=55968 RepID=UPI000E64A4AE|nr:amidohydrolase family protein [Leucobacter aridicollis]UTX52499.1 amidohydrolase family protein [Leucobacter aridicollis]
MTLTPSTGFALTGARLITNTPDHAGATALLVEHGRITSLGDDTEIEALAIAAGYPVRDANGATVTAGLFDSHTHPHWAADVTRGVDLGGLGTITEIQAAVASYAATLPADAWVLGWNLEFEPFEATGVRGDLFDAAVTGRPFAAMFYDLHSGLANAAALAAAGVTEAPVFEDMSEVVVDEAGTLTGELREPSAYKLVFDAVPALSHDDERDSLRDMFRTLAAAGLTGGAIMDGKPRTVDLIEELDERGELDHRLVVHHWHAVTDDDEAVARVIASKDRRGNLWESDGIKLFSDGVIDTGTAWLHQPDACGDGTHAFWPDWDRYRSVVRAYHDAGMIIATHAVGDFAVNRVLDAYAELPARGDARPHSIEHLEVLADEDLEKLTGSGVTASMQPLHMQWREGDDSDNWAVRLGERAATGYRVRDVLETGTRVTLGSDWPVAHYDPRIGMAWARGRSTPGVADAHVFEPEQRLTGEEALLAYTLWPALARGYDDRGVLAPGALADLTIWDGDPVAATPDELVSLAIAATVVDGRFVHDAL